MYCWSGDRISQPARPSQPAALTLEVLTVKKWRGRKFDRACKTDTRVISTAPRCPGCNVPLLANPKHPDPRAAWECVFCQRYFTADFPQTGRASK